MIRLLAAVAVAVAVAVVGFAVGTYRDPAFWQSPDRRGDALLTAGNFPAAAKAYADPARAGVALFRNGDFEAAAKAFARVPGADGHYDQGNALLMHGKYDAAIQCYDRALAVRSGWAEAADNRGVAAARKARLDAAGQTRDQEQANAYQPDEVVFDQQGDDQKGKPVELSGGQAMDDAALQATWLRRVQTTPGDSLRAKFAYQAAKGGAK